MVFSRNWSRQDLMMSLMKSSPAMDILESEMGFYYPDV
jgi:hypothetical protein